MVEAWRKIQPECLQQKEVTEECEPAGGLEDTGVTAALQPWGYLTEISDPWLMAHGGSPVKSRAEGSNY